MKQSRPRPEPQHLPAPEPEDGPRPDKLADGASPAHWIAILLIVVVGVSCYLNSFQNAFHYDDIHSILENDSVRTLNPKRVWEANSHARFVSMYSFSLNYACNGFGQLRGWHSVNVAAHVLCSLLVYGLALHLGMNRRRRMLALLAALLFAVHPLCSEPVNYIQARSAQFVTLFSIGAAFCLALCLEGRSRWWIALALLCVGMGCLSKEVGAYYVGTACLLVIGFRGRLQRLAALARKPWVWGIVASAAALLGVFAYATGILAGIAYRLSMVDYWPYVARQAAAFFSYLRLMFIPFGLAADHFERPPMAIDAVSAMALLGFAGVGVLVAWLWKRKHPLAFPLAWLLVMHLPYLFVPGPEVIVEYRTYPMIVGFALALAWLATRFLTDRRILIVAGAGVVLSLAVITVNRNTVWKDGVTLWSNCLARNEVNPRAHNNLGNAYLQNGDLDRARREFGRALELAPAVAEVHFNMGALHVKEKKYQAAVAELLKAVTLKPSLTRAYNALGAAYSLAEDFDKGIQSFEKALSLDPNFIQARNGLGNAYAGKGMYDKAIGQYMAVLAWGIESPEVYRNLGDAYKGKGDLKEAVRLYQKSLSLDSHSAETHNNLGNAYKDMGRVDDAIEEYRRAAVLDPNYAVAHNNLGSAYLLAGKLKEAEGPLRTAMEKDPAYASAQCNMGSLLHMRGDEPGAERFYREAVRLNPGYVDAYYNLGIVLQKQKRPRDAVEAYQDVVRIRPDWAAAHAALGLLWLELGDRSKAKDLLMKAVRMQPQLAKRPDISAALRGLGAK